MLNILNHFEVSTSEQNLYMLSCAINREMILHAYASFSYKSSTGILHLEMPDSKYAS